MKFLKFVSFIPVGKDGQNVKFAQMDQMALM